MYSQKIRILHKSNQKRILIRKYKPAWKYVHMQYNITSQYLIRAPFALEGFREAQVALLEAFSSFELLDFVFLFFLLTISHSFSEVQIRPVCQPVQSNLIMVIKPGIGTFGSVGSCQILLENESGISIKLANRCMVFYSFLVGGCVDFGLQKTQRTNTSRSHADCGNTAA
ncbi:hypothetical protein ILYODFUR_033443 [Ilyodon furcidens]|uniref:Uncharacterized protein n=1 Tax=Ilyodon furcidens TaxID=33524 RepID=A0ABV0SR96_9TELE